MKIEFREAYETQAIIADDMQNKIKTISRMLMDDADETLDVISNLNASDIDIVHVKKITMTHLNMAGEIIDLSGDVSDYIHTNQEMYPKFNKYISITNKTIKSINDCIKRVRYIMDSYINGLEYDEITDGRRFFSSPFHDEYVDICISKNVLTINHGDDKIMSYNLEIPKLKLKDEFRDNEIAIPKSLGIVSLSLFQEMRSNSIYTSPPLEWSIYKFLLKWFFQCYVLKHRKYLNYLIDKYSEVLKNNIKNRDTISFQNNNIVLLGIVDTAQCPMIYDRIHKNIIQDL